MTDLITTPHQELVSGAHPLDLAIVAWLDAKAGRSGSVHTARIYRSTIANFRVQLHVRSQTTNAVDYGHTLG